MKEKAKLEEEKKDEEKEDPKGIPEFWLTVFKNVDLLSDMLQVGPGRALLLERRGKWVTRFLLTAVGGTHTKKNNQDLLPPAGRSCEEQEPKTQIYRLFVWRAV